MEKQYLLEMLRGKLVSADVRAGDVVIVAVSGGSDSMALLDVANRLAKRDGFEVVVGHVNHGLRKNAAHDQAVVEAYCREHGLSCVVRSAKLAGLQRGIEERARLVRYKLLRDIKQTSRAKWILTAHTSDDQVETIVLNFLRGSGVRGLGGMKFISEDILRPWLGVSKDRLLKYLKRQRIKFAEDETNARLDFMRNRVRHCLLPVLGEYNPRIREVLLQNSELFQQTDILIRQLANHSFALIGKIKDDKVSISISRLRELLPIVQMGIVRLAMEKLLGNVQGIKKIHIDTVFGLIANRRSKLVRRLPGKLLLEKAYDTITISRGEG